MARFSLDRFRRKDPEEVFTPRSPHVNPSMYIMRPEHERALFSAIRSGYNVVIYGDSGCGKSWLYKRVFDENGIFYCTLDFSSVFLADDVDLLILECAARYEAWQEKEKKEGAHTEFAPQNVGGGKDWETSYEKSDVGAYEQLVQLVRAKAGGNQKAVIVFENLEHALDKPDVIARIQAMLLSVDDPHIGRYNVRICMVGVPAEIKEVLTDKNKYQTISNRVYEVPEVARLSREGVELLAKRGFIQELDLDVESITFCISQISFFSDRIPQYIHDICLQTALLAEDNQSRVDPALVESAMDKWVASNARQSLELISGAIRSHKGINIVKARTAYAIAVCQHSHFQASDIDDLCRKHFPKTVGGRRLQTLATLRRLADGEYRILRCGRDGHTFRIATPKLRSTMRAMLQLDDSETVSVRRVI